MNMPKAWKPFEKKTYVIAYDEYMGCFPDMAEVQSTWRELLEDLNGVTDENRDVRDPEDPPGTKLFPAEYSDDELVKMFDDANGDGQCYVQVWCVDEHRQVLGGRKVSK